MAMTKAEKAEVDRLREDLALARAMRWPSYPKPAPMTRAEIDANKVDGGIRYGQPQRVARGWFPNAYDQRVTYGCSDGIHHDRGGNTTSSQQMGVMYAAKADALRAIRIEMTLAFAKKLAAVDQQIDEAEAE